MKYQRYPWVIILSALLLISHNIDFADAADPELNVPVEVTQANVQHSNVPNLLFGNEGNYVQLYGQINKGILRYDDGRSTRSYFPVDNTSSSTRFGIRSFHRLDEDWSIGSNLEVEWDP